MSDTSEYEKHIKGKIAQNKNKLVELGLTPISKLDNGKKSKEPKDKHRTVAQHKKFTNPTTPRRSSDRLHGSKSESLRGSQDNKKSRREFIILDPSTTCPPEQTIQHYHLKLLRIFEPLYAMLLSGEINTTIESQYTAMKRRAAEIRRTLAAEEEGVYRQHGSGDPESEDANVNRNYKNNNNHNDEEDEHSPAEDAQMSADDSGDAEMHEVDDENNVDEDEVAENEKQNNEDEEHDESSDEQDIVDEKQHHEDEEQDAENEQQSDEKEENNDDVHSSEHEGEKDNEVDDNDSEHEAQGKTVANARKSHRPQSVKEVKSSKIKPQQSKQPAKRKSTEKNESSDVSGPVDIEDVECDSNYEQRSAEAEQGSASSEENSGSDSNEGSADASESNSVSSEESEDKSAHSNNSDES
jgi:hypothetical protein